MAHEQPAAGHAASTRRERRRELARAAESTVPASGDDQGLFRPARRPLVAVSVTVAAGVLVLVLGFVMKSTQADLGIVAALNRLRSGLWGSISDAVYRGIEPVPALIITVIIALVVWLGSRSFRTALAFGAVVALTWLPVAVFKVIVDRPRPEASALAHPFSPAQTDGSFPSGHTAYIVALTIALWFLLRGTRWSWLVVVLGSASTLVVAAAVVSDGLHFPTDALASIIWALAMAPTARWFVVDVVLRRVLPARGTRSRDGGSAVDRGAAVGRG